MMDDLYLAQERTGYAYVPVQKFGKTYSPEEGLERGTIFPELDLPISVYGCKID